jgi:hypothetical protein
MALGSVGGRVHTKPHMCCSDGAVLPPGIKPHLWWATCESSDNKLNLEHHQLKGHRPLLRAVGS